MHQSAALRSRAILAVIGLVSFTNGQVLLTGKVTGYDGMRSARELIEDAIVGG